LNDVRKQFGAIERRDRFSNPAFSLVQTAIRRRLRLTLRLARTYFCENP
jgi:hypothetical protein